MRGTPFLKEAFTGGLNTIDSPYTVAENEARDCLNVVSTDRGAIRKRNGSTILIPPTFPSLLVSDSFSRANEQPLSNGGKWSAISGFPNTGEISELRWRPNKTEAVSGARWNVAEQPNPVVSVQMFSIGTYQQIALWACLSVATKTGYRFVYTVSTTTIGEVLVVKKEVAIEYWANGLSSILASGKQAFGAGDSIGFSVRNGVLTGWREDEGAWSSVLSVSHSALTTGYVGFDSKIEAPSGRTKLSNFSFGEMPGGTFGTSELTSLAPVTVEGGTYLIASAGAKLYSINAGAEVSTIGEGFTSGLPWSILQAPKGTKKTAGPVYLTNGKDKPQYWSGAAKTTKTALWEGEAATVEEKVAYEDPTTKEHVPNGKFMIFAGNRVWMTGIADDPSAVRFSEDSPIGSGGEQGDPTWWPANNVVRFDGTDGTPITGIGVVGPYVVVFKERKTWVIHNLDTGENRKLSDNIGCIAQRSIVETNEGTFFLTADQGVYLTDGTKLVEMSYKVRPSIIAINPAVREQAAATYYNNHYYLSFASGTSAVSNRTLDYDVQLKSWWLHDLAGRQWAKWSPITGEPNLFTIPPTRFNVVRAFVPNVYTDSGENYAGNGALASWWISNWEPFAYYVFRHRIKAPFLKKRVRQIFFNGSGEINPIIYKDFGTAGLSSAGTVGNAPSDIPTFPVNFSQNEPIFGNSNEEQLFAGEVYEGVEMVFGGGAEVAAARVYAPGIAFVWSVGWGNNSAEPFEVDAFTYMLQFRKS